MNRYNKIKEENRKISEESERKPLNAYRSSSPMNELCDYICTWEKKKILWDNDTENLVDVRCLIINNDLALDDKSVIKTCKKYIKKYKDELQKHINLKEESLNDEKHRLFIHNLSESYKTQLKQELNLEEELIANYVIKAAYSSVATNKAFVWVAYGDYIIKNLKANSNPQRNVSINEVSYKTNNSYEYLGKFYDFKVGDQYL